MEQITFNPNNEPYYSEDFIKGFNCGAQRQFEADKADRPQGEWIAKHNGYWRCSECGLSFLFYAKGNYCPNCGSRMSKGADDEMR